MNNMIHHERLQSCSTHARIVFLNRGGLQQKQTMMHIHYWPPETEGRGLVKSGGQAPDHSGGVQLWTPRQ